MEVGDVYSLVEVLYEDNVVYGSYYVLGLFLVVYILCYDVVVVWVYKDLWDLCGDVYILYYEVVDILCLDVLVYYEVYNVFYIEV